MLALTIILLVLLLLFAGALFTPVILYVDTDLGRYEIFQLPVFRYSILLKDNVVKPRLRLLGIEINLKPKTDYKPKIKKAKPGSRAQKSLDAWLFLIQRLIRSFTVKKVVADLDTGDVVLNAQLFPVFMIAGREPVMLRINFSGRVYFHLEVSNRPAHILWIILKFLIKK